MGLEPHAEPIVKLPQQVDQPAPQTRPKMNPADEAEKEQGRKDESKLRELTAQRIFAALQFTLEDGALQLEAERDKDKLTRHAIELVDAANLLVDEVDNVWVGASAHSSAISTDAIRVHADSASRACEIFVGAILGDDPVYDKALDLGVRLKRVREHFGLPPLAAANARRRSASRTDHAAAAIAALELVRLEANNAYQDVRLLPLHDSSRDAVVTEAAGSMGSHLRSCVAMLQAGAAKPDANAIHRTSVAVMELDMWVDSRNPNHLMKARTAPIVGTCNSLRALAGLGAIDLARNGARPLSPQDQGAADKESREIAGQIHALGSTLATLLNGYTDGANQFAAHAKLTDPPPPNSLWETLLMTACLGALDHLAGGQLKRLMNLERLAVKPSADAQAFILDATKRLPSTTINTIAAESVKKGALSAKDREIEALKHSLVSSQAMLVEQANQVTTDAIKHKNLSHAELVAMNESAKSFSAGTIATAAYNAASVEYAKLLTALALGQAGTQERSKHEKEYFQHRFTSAQGIARLNFSVVEWREKETVWQVSTGELVGLNSLMYTAVTSQTKTVEDLVQLGIPVECHFGGVTAPNDYYGHSIFVTKDNFAHHGMWPLSRTPRVHETIKGERVLPPTGNGQTASEAWAAVRHLTLSKVKQ